MKIAIFLLFIGQIAFGRIIDLSLPDSDFYVDKNKIVPVYISRDAKSEKIGFLPAGSYIKALQKADAQGWQKMRFAYVAARPECKKASDATEAHDRIKNIFNSSVVTMSLPNESVQLNIRTTLKDYGMPDYCFKMNEGYVMASQLSGAKPTQYEARATEPSECVDCKTEKNELKAAADNLAKNILDSIDSNKEIVTSPMPTKSELCGKVGSPKLFTLPNITIKGEWKRELTKAFAEAQNSKGEKYKKSVLKEVWKCELSFPNGCQKEDDVSLGKIVSIANFFVEKKDKASCEQALNKYYGECSVWKNKNFPERYKAVEQASRKTISGLKKSEGASFSNQITPELLQCIAVRENHTLEPLRVSYRACEPRINPKAVYRKAMLEYLGDYDMLNWKSAAYGLSQHRFETFKENWDKFLKDEKPLFYNPKNKSYEQLFESAEVYFDSMMDYPELQIEKIARDLNFRINKFNFKRCLAKHPKYSKFDCAILSYDGDQEETYLPAVKKCMSCLNYNPQSIDCLKKLHTQKGSRI